MQDTITPIVARAAIRNVFHVYRRSGISRNTSEKFDQRNGRGHSAGVSACRSVMSAVRTIRTTGSKKTAETAINTVWFATPIRKRRRRTSGASGRRTICAASRGRDRTAVSTAI